MTTTTSAGLEGLVFDNRFTNDLPADPDGDPRSREVTGAAFSRVAPRPPTEPRVIAISPEVMADLGLDPAIAASPEFAKVFTGASLLHGSDPHAMAYGGHQFGHWAGQLGDGRAIALGDVIGADQTRLTLQLKGAGPTPYSRRADGLAVLRSSLREFLCSEAMFHLRVPTTRALSLALTGDQVLRDMFYDGNPEYEPGAVVCRVAPSFVRFGNFQLFAARGEIDHLRSLADHVIDTLFPDFGPPSIDAYVGVFGEVVRRTAHLMVEWARVGFVHGVMNTDNMSILGLTIDYGPYGWLEGYDPDWTPNTTDARDRRYRFGNQPGIAHWNLMQFANALIPLVGDTEPLQEALDGFVPTFRSGWEAMMTAKLGLERFDGPLVDSLLEALGSTETDMTIFFRDLAGIGATRQSDDLLEPILDAFYRPEEATGPVRSKFENWISSYEETLRVQSVDEARRQLRMNSVNPRFVLRNYLAQEAIDLANSGDESMIGDLLDVLRRPYDEQPGKERFAAKRPEWARVRAGCSMLSCSS